jgi:hypothetical protein
MPRRLLGGSAPTSRLPSAALRLVLLLCLVCGKATAGDTCLTPGVQLGQLAHRDMSQYVGSMPLSLSSDGTVLALGADLLNKGVGGVRVYRPSDIGSAWEEVAGSPLLGSGNTGSPGIGYSVSLSSDGSVLAAGGPRDNHGVGGICVWRRLNGSAYSLMPGMPLVGSGYKAHAEVDDYGETYIQVAQGAFVSLSSDGAFLAVGGPQNNHFVGGTWVWRYNGTAYEELSGMPLVGIGCKEHPGQGR